MEWLPGDTDFVCLMTHGRRSGQGRINGPGLNVKDPDRSFLIVQWALELPTVLMHIGGSEALVFLARLINPTRGVHANNVQRSSRRCMIGAIIVLIFAFVTTYADAQEPVLIDTEREYNVKGAFLYSFGRYTTWPTDNTEKEGDPFVIGVYGDAPITRILRRIEMTKKINGRAIKFRHFRKLEEAKSYHILFVSRSVPEIDQKRIIRLNQGSATLVVGEIDEFTERGGVARFFIADGSVKFEINLTAARRKRLSFDAKLLRLARVIEPPS